MADRGRGPGHDRSDVSAEHLLLTALARCSISSLEHFARQKDVEVSASAYASGTVTRREDKERTDSSASSASSTSSSGRARRRRAPRPAPSAEWGCFIGASPRSGAEVQLARQWPRPVKWILAAGVLVAVGAIAVSWYRGGEDSAAIGEPLVPGERHHRVIAGRPRPRAASSSCTSGAAAARPPLAGARRLARDHGANAPAVLLVDGGDHSYYHDRDDFDWGTHILEEAIPPSRATGTPTRARRRSAASRWAASAPSTSPASAGSGAVGAHPALWEGAGQTPEGAFDDAEDFERHDVLERARAAGPLPRGASVARRRSRRQLPGQHRPARRARRRSGEDARPASTPRPTGGSTWTSTSGSTTRR